MARPYQPSLLRLLHAPVALVVALLWLSGVVIYGLHDGRLWRLAAAPADLDWIDLHGSAGVALVLLATLFVPYALSLGRAQLRRGANLLPLVALLLSLGSGLLMGEDEMRAGRTGSWIYGLHLGGWALMTLALLLHVGGVLQRGGWPLAVSMFRPELRDGDRPADWPAQLRRFVRRG